MNPAEKVQALRKSDVFATADDESLEWLAEHAEPESYQSDQVVFLEGETSSRVYVVVSGTFQIRLGESCKLVSVAEAGSLFGEYAMFVKGRIANVVAAEPSTLLSFEEADFREFLLRCPTVMMQLLQTAVRRLYRVERNRG